jgi:aspartate ammonia-lyase
MTTRSEHDALGPVEVPKEAYWGAQTQRALDNFPLSGLPTDPELGHAIALIKRAAARANRELGELDPARADAIERAAAEVQAGRFDAHLVVDAFQAGAGTSTHMNVNEVVANRANELLGHPLGSYAVIHPNDHVNMGQSTNDVVPTAMRLAARAFASELDRGLDRLIEAFLAKAREFDGVVKAGRTHLQDAVPIRLGQEFGAYGHALARARQDIAQQAGSLAELGLGGTAVGTGLNTLRAYRHRVVEQLRDLTGDRELRESADYFTAMQSMAPFAALSGALRVLAIELGRISNDLRLLSSGPRTGLAEITLPAVQPGSSIMPGKVNPSVPEMVNQVCFQVMGQDATVAIASQAGQLELNVMMPVIAHNLLGALRLLSRAVPILAARCVSGIQANVERCRAYAETTVGLATVLNPRIGYEQAAELAKESVRTGESVRALVKKRGLLADQDLETALSPAALTEPVTL